MNRKVAVSVITVTYNRASMISRALRSVLNQSFTDFEYLIIDDGSGDNTKEIIEGIADPRIRYIRVPHSGRISFLRNHGIKESSGEMIAFIDSDDCWSENKISIQVEALIKNAAAGFAFSDVELVWNDDQKKRISYLPGGNDIGSRNYFPGMIRGSLPVYPSSLIFRRSCLDAVGLIDEKMIAGETDFMTRLFYYYEGVYINQPLVWIRKHERNHSSSHIIEAHAENLQTLNYFYKKKEIGIVMHRKLSAFHHRSIAKYMSRLSNKKDALNHFVKSILLNPLDVRNISGIIKMYMIGGK